MKRIAFTMKLKPGCAEEYKKRHDAIWPELAELLGKAGISEYSIFLDSETNTLFAFQKQSGNHGSQDLASEPLVKKWWAYMADIMETNDDLSPVSKSMTEVFYLQ